VSVNEYHQSLAARRKGGSFINLVTTQALWLCFGTAPIQAAIDSLPSPSPGPGSRTAPL
jgi:hypothetical protein